jgi:hypothetical protein
MAPPTGEVVIHALASGTAGQQKVESVSLLGSTSVLFEQKDDGLYLKPSAQSGKFPVVYKIQFAGH